MFLGPWSGSGSLSHKSADPVRIFRWNKNSRKTFIYCYLTTLWLFIFEEWFKCTCVPDLHSAVLRLADTGYLSRIRFFHPGSQFWGSVTFWCGSGSPDLYLWITDPKKKFFFLQPCPQAYYLQSKNSNLVLKCCVNILFFRKYFSPLNTFMRKWKDPDSDLWLINPDSDPGGPKTCGSLVDMIPDSHQKKFRVVHPGSRILALDHFPIPDQDPGLKKVRILYTDAEPSWKRVWCWFSLRGNENLSVYCSQNLS